MYAGYRASQAAELQVPQDNYNNDIRGDCCYSLISEVAAQGRIGLELVPHVYTVVALIVTWHRPLGIGTRQQEL